MQAKFPMKQISVALAAAGFGLAVGAGYNRLDAPALSQASAATPPAVSSPVAATAAARLPDFTVARRKRRRCGRQHQHGRHDAHGGLRPG